MDDALGVRGLERIGNLNGQIEHFGELERLAILPAAPATSALRAAPWPAAADRRRRRSRRSCRCSGGSATRRRALRAGNARVREWSARDCRRQKLQRNVTAEFGVVGAIHHTHPTRADLLEDAIVRDDLANHVGGRLSELRGLRFAPGGPLPASTARAARAGMASAHESPTAANSMRRCSGGEVGMDARDDSRFSWVGGERKTLVSPPERLAGPPDTPRSST